MHSAKKYYPCNQHQEAKISQAKTHKKIAKIVIAYPFALILIGLAINLLLFSIQPATIALLTPAIMITMISSAVLLLANHIWLMTSTELTRLQHNIRTTPEEWEQSEHNKADVSEKGTQELERRHNAHRNTTENVVYFAFLAILISIISPVAIAAQIWMIGFAINRLGYTFAYLTGCDGTRGIFMSISLVSLFGLASYLMLSLLV